MGGMTAPCDRGARPRILIIVQNLPVPFDRRVWLECTALTAAGYDVTVICPRGKNDPSHQILDGVTLLKYRPYAPGGGAAGFVVEYAYSFLATARLVLRARREGRFDVLQACNPPDIFWPIARWLRRRDASRFVFDHHDLCPELYDSRFPQGRPLPRRGLVALERATFRSADHVVSTNASYAEIALRRGQKRPADVTVVRTGPDPERLRRQARDPVLRRGRSHLVAYIGVMGPQDGVDLAVRAAAHIVHDLDRQDVSFTFMGAGDCYDEIVALRDTLGLQDYLELPGRVPDETVIDVLSTADVGLSPDPKNPLNDVSTMNKTLEYMAFGIPVVAFDLKETRVSANGAGSYVPSGDVAAYAREIVALLDDDDKREDMGREGRLRIEKELGWPHQRAAYVGVYDRLVGRTRTAARQTRPQARG
jgi:glycosyltransferase involved in cell wall biosynthesis